MDVRALEAHVVTVERPGAGGVELEPRLEARRNEARRLAVVLVDLGQAGEQ